MEIRGRMTPAFKIVFGFVCLIGLSFVECFKERYDFIIVGGGTAGLVVARKLSDQKFNVLVIESGGFPKDGMDIPAFTPRFLGDPEVTFRYRSVKQWRAGLSTNGIISVMAGRMVSGTSSLNYMWFNRGHPKDYDNWANLTGDPSWSYANMLRHFKNMETYAGEFPSDQHGYHGPITITQPRYAPGLKMWLEAGKSLNYPVFDQNGPQQISFTPVEFSKRFGRRVSSLTAYISPILNSTKNLDIMTNTNATQIVFEGNRAIGVRIKSSLPLEHDCIYASKEIIVSSGALGSPLLLQRSGIGPADLLKSARIPIIKELPVGLNFQAHTSIPLGFAINDSSVVFDEARDLTPKNLDYYENIGDGPYSVGRGATGQAFIASSIAKLEGEGTWPDLQIAMSHSTLPYVGFTGVNFTNADGILKEREVPMSASVFIMRPKSRGSIKINIKDPIEGMPEIDLGYFMDERDMVTALDGIRETLRIYEGTEVYKRIGTRLRLPDLPVCSSRYWYRSRPYWKCYIEYVSLGACHPAGTCAMGSGTKDPHAVVDTRLRVIGIQGLRVVDASIMPYVTNGNTQAAVYGIAEKGSEMILEDWKL